MSENVQITPGSGVTIGADSVVDVTLGSAQIQFIKIMDGTIGGTNKAAVTANGLAVDGSGATQPVSALTLPLPTGASTSANQTTEIGLLTTIAANTTDAGTPVVSGTVTVVQPTASNLNATVVQTIAANLVTEAWLNDGSGNAISSISGSLSVDVTNFPATQPISGTVSISGTVPVSGTITTIPPVNASTNLTEVGGSAVALGQTVSANSLPVVISSDQSSIPVTGTITTSPDVNVHDGTGNAITSTTGSLNVNVTNASGLDTVNQGNPNTLANAWPVELSDGTNLLGVSAHPVRVDPTGTTTQPISGTVAVTQSTSPWVVSGTVTSNIGTTNGLALDATVAALEVAQASTTSGQNGILQLGAVTTGSPTYTTAQTNALSLTTVGALRVDASATIQPISGTVTANAGTGNFTVIQPTASNLNATVSGTVIATQATGTNLHTVVDSGSIAVSNFPVTQPVSLPSDIISATQNITIQDTITISGAGANNQTFYTGTPTVGSVALFSVSTIESIDVQVTGTWTGTLQLESSLDGGTTWYKNGGHQKGVTFNSSSFTANFQVSTNVAGTTMFRVRAIAAWTGSATVFIVQSINADSIYILNALQLLDGGTTGNKATIKAASIAALATDTSLVVALSPNSSLPTGTNSIGSISVTNFPALQTVQQSATLAIAIQTVGITAASSGDNIVIAAPGAGHTIFVFAWNISFSGIVNAKFTAGSAGTLLSGLYYGIVNAGGGNAVSPPNYLWSVGSNTALVINLSAAVAVGGSVSYFII